jgi:hypothetical protein
VEVDQGAVADHIQFLPTVAAVVSLEVVVAHRHSKEVGHTHLLPSLEEEEEEEDHPSEGDRIDFHPNSKVAVAAVVVAVVGSS